MWIQSFIFCWSWRWHTLLSLMPCASDGENAKPQKSHPYPERRFYSWRLRLLTDCLTTLHNTSHGFTLHNHGAPANEIWQKIFQGMSGKNVRGLEVEGLRRQERGQDFCCRLYIVGVLNYVNTKLMQSRMCDFWRWVNGVLWPSCCTDDCFVVANIDSTVIMIQLSIC